MKKRSVMIGGHSTSVSLEDEFWIELKRMAKLDGRSLAALVSDIDDQRTAENLSSELRLAVLRHMRKERNQSSRN